MRNAKLLERWKHNQERRERFITRVAALTKDQRHHRPSKNEFNALEVMAHMALAEGTYLPLLKKHDPQKLRLLPPKPTFLFPFVVRKMREAKPVPTAGIMTPKSTPDFDEAKRRWDQVRNEIEEALLGTPEEGTFVKHPIFGKLGPVHFLELIDAHLEYHEKRFPIKDR